MADDESITANRVCVVCARSLSPDNFGKNRRQCKDCRRTYHLAHSRQPEVKERQHKRDRERVRTVEQLERKRAAERDYNSRPEIKAHKREYMADPERKRKYANKTREAYQNAPPEKKAKIIARVCERARLPEVRIRINARLRERYWTDPDYRQRYNAASTERAKKPEVRKKNAARQRERMADPAIREKANEYQRTWKQRPENKRKQAARAHRRRCAEGKFTAQDIERLLAVQKGKCAICGKRLGSKYDVDHITPIAKGGTNWPRNLQILCVTCNRRKRDDDPIEHMRKLGKLL